MYGSWYAKRGEGGGDLYVLIGCAGDTEDPIRQRDGMYSTLSAWGLEVGGKGGSSSPGPLQSQDKFMLLRGGDVLMLYQNINERPASRVKQQRSIHHCFCRKLEDKNSTVKPHMTRIIYLLKVWMELFVLLSCFYWKVCCKVAQWQWRAPLFVLYRPLTVHPTFSSRAAAGEKEASSSKQKWRRIAPVQKNMARGREAGVRSE